MILILDTETNGFASGSRPNTDPRQPHIVELAATLVDRDNQTLDELNVIVRPDGWDTGDEDCLAVHGITVEQAIEEGIAEFDALERLLAMKRRAQLVVCHNIGFDIRIVEIGLSRHHPDEVRPWLATPTFCTMDAAGRVCGHKNRKLAVAYSILCAGEHDAAHQALADVDACRAIFFELIARGAYVLPDFAEAA